jgi:hypothetical protein
MMDLLLICFRSTAGGADGLLASSAELGIADLG